MRTDLQRKQVTRMHILSQRFCKEVEKVQIIFGHQLDQCQAERMTWLHAM